VQADQARHALHRKTGHKVLLLLGLARAERRVRARVNVVEANRPVIDRAEKKPATGIVGELHSDRARLKTAAPRLLRQSQLGSPIEPEEEITGGLARRLEKLFDTEIVPLNAQQHERRYQAAGI